MKTIRRTISCRNIRSEIEEADQGDQLSSAANDHLQQCAGCETFYREQFKLRQIVSSLGTVAAPGDFDFRLRARLAGEKRGAPNPFGLINVSFGFRASAFAAVLFFIGSGLLFVSLRPTTNNSSVADNQLKPDAAKPPDKASMSVPQKNDVTPSALVAAQPHTDRTDAVASLNPGGRRSARKSAGTRGTDRALAGNPRVASKDLASTQAPVLKPNDMVADAGHSVFPIEASAQRVKVSLENGRGSSKTISLPGVSFGSQRVLTENAPPLLASARGAW